MRMDLVFFTRVPIDLNGKKIIFSNLTFLVLPFQKVEKGCVPKFDALIFNLALVVKKWPHFAGSTVYASGTVFPRSDAAATINFPLLALAATIRGRRLLEGGVNYTLQDSLLFSSINFDYVMFKSTNNNGCGQYALIGVRLLFEGGDYNIQGLAGGGYYSRAATSRAASDRGNTVCEKNNKFWTRHQFVKALSW